MKPKAKQSALSKKIALGKGVKKGVERRGDDYATVHSVVRHEERKATKDYANLKATAKLIQDEGRARRKKLGISE